MNMIISANYRDRNNKDYRYLVRRENQSVGDAIQVKEVIVTGPVTFRQSSAQERGFGCGVVAVADSSDITLIGIAPLDPVELQFNGFAFSDGQREVHEVRSLFLRNDGKILASV